MANMGYCRFRNTLQDLQDCDEHLEDDLHGEEFEARMELIQICTNIAKWYKDNCKDLNWDEEEEDDD